MIQLLFILLSVPSLVWFTLYLIPQIYTGFLASPTDCKKRYEAEWALVTGGGSGIGRSLCLALAKQGLNVVIVSLDDDFLKRTLQELRDLYPKQEFRSVGVTFAPNVDYMKKIEAATKDLLVQCVFCNAGYMVTGFTDQTDPAKLKANMECNATAAMNVSHHFSQRLVKECKGKPRKGCIVFTSSVAGFIPTPFAALYASTKAFVSQWAACLSIELSPLGIDVCSIHPSPVQSQFYSNLTHKVDMIESAAAAAVTPDVVVTEILKSVGHCVYRDVGGLAWGTRMGTWFLPYNAFATLFAMAAPYMPDWKKHNVGRE